MKECLSTHGGAGYTSYDYWDGNDIICGFCGARIKNPPPTGWSWVYGKGLRRGHWESTWFGKFKPRAELFIMSESETKC